MELELVKHLPKDMSIKLDKKAVLMQHIELFIQHILVYEVENKVAGCIISYSGENELKYEKAWELLDLPEKIKQYGTPLPEETKTIGA